MEPIDGSPSSESSAGSELGLAPEVLEKLRLTWDFATREAGSAKASWEAAAKTSELEGKLLLFHRADEDEN